MRRVSFSRVTWAVLSCAIANFIAFAAPPSAHAQFSCRGRYGIPEHLITATNVAVYDGGGFARVNSEIYDSTAWCSPSIKFASLSFDIGLLNPETGKVYHSPRVNLGLNAGQEGGSTVLTSSDWDGLSRGNLMYKPPICRINPNDASCQFNVEFPRATGVTRIELPGNAFRKGQQFIKCVAWFFDPAWSPWILPVGYNNQEWPKVMGETRQLFTCAYGTWGNEFNYIPGKGLIR